MREIKSPVENWPGTITLPEPFNLSQMCVIQDMLDALDEMEEKRRANNIRVNKILVPFLFQLVEEWNIEGIEQDPEKFPGEPVVDVSVFVMWWFNAVVGRFIEKKDDDPKNE